MKSDSEQPNNHPTDTNQNNAERDTASQDIVLLLERYRPLLRAIAAGEIDLLLQAKIDPSDVVQDVCIEVMKSTDNLPVTDSKKFSSYLRRVMSNKLHDLKRRFVASHKRSVHREQTENELHADKVVDAETATVDILGNLVDEEMLDRTRTALRSLPIEVQKVIYLRFIKNLTYAEIGQRVNRSADDVRMFVKRWLERLKQEVASTSSSSGAA